MSAQVLDIFYNIFWKDKACQNLFMLSKNELLATKTIEIEGNRSYFSIPRVLITNVNSKEENLEVLKIRTEVFNSEKEKLINETLSEVESQIVKFIDLKYGKAFQKFSDDFDKRPVKFILKNAFKVYRSRERETELVKILHHYGFVPHHLNSFVEIEKYVLEVGIKKNYKTFINEENYYLAHQILRALKELYLNINLQSFLVSNQVEVKTRFDTENFNSRIKLFSILYEQKIIQDSGEDCFVECMNCNPGTYKGTLHLKIKPSNLSKLKCIHCNEELTYYMPYSLNDELYQLVNAKDGLIANLFEVICQSKELRYRLNVILLKDIEIDGIFELHEVNYFVEMKMYELRAGKDKIASRIKQHTNKLCEDLVRIRKEANPKGLEIKPILLVNVLDNQWLLDLEKEIHTFPQNTNMKECRLMNVNMLKEFINPNT